MHRQHINELESWKSRPTRKPLVIRGARQVGKTWLVREFARVHFKNLVEINFDERPEKADLFTGREIAEVLGLLEVDQGQNITPGETLLFLDEIQSAPKILAQLRYFYEKRPDLHVITAGSLLDFSLASHEYSMPVGRIEYLFMGPMSFSEFLTADGMASLSSFISQVEVGVDVPESFHTRLLEQVRRYYITGGMPAVVQAYIANHRWDDVSREQRSILQTFVDDFAKYGRRMDTHRLRKVFLSLPRLVGRKLKYTHIDREARAKDLARCMELLEMARIVHRVSHSAANGLPLGAEAKPKDFKPLFLDIGLLCNALGLRLTDFDAMDEAALVNNGAATEQFIGQHLLYSGPGYEMPELYYWNREKKSSAAEVDYVKASVGQIIPIEVKAGKKGTLRSLNLFMYEKKRDLAVRFDTNRPSAMQVEVKIPGKGRCAFRLLSLPLYLVEHLERFINTEMKRVQNAPKS